MTRPILGISTSSGRGSVALRGDGLRVARVYDALHAEHLLPQLDALLAEAGCRRVDLAGVACDIGPGSFTGVRVGVACAKGIAVGLGLPLAGVVSLAAMAHDAFAAGALATGDVALALLDAKRGEVFAAAYDASGALLLAPLYAPNAAAASLAERLPGRRVVLVGAAAHARAGAGVPAGTR
ncbi:MAG: tRNA (adenosine(37)-N6)-threonylcarbamoyltransferase complex dimerization subunit type 1 TsaB [Polyangiaceae bacterium]